MYEIECYNRASMADSLVHPVFKRGHSNYLEASHNVLIRFRSKDLTIERLHYEVSTNLGLLQSNLTYISEKRGYEYHWIPDLYKRLNLPLYDGIEEAYKKENLQRKRKLDYKKKESVKRRRIELLNKRAADSIKQKEWTKKHGGDAYDESGCGNTIHTNKKPLKKRKISDKRTKSIVKKEKVFVDTDTEDEYDDPSFSDGYEDEKIFEDKCNCNSFSKSHKRNCPMNPRELNKDASNSKKYCKCLGKATKNMVGCDEPKCPIEWFHFECIGLHEAPISDKWFCENCSQIKSVDNALTPTEGIFKTSQSEEIKVQGPLPTNTWKTSVNKFCSKWAEINIVVQESPLINTLPCKSISPHIRDSVSGDGNCLFRVFSKELSGTESNHRAFRIAIIKFMLHKDNVQHFCNRYSLPGTDSSIAMETYIDEKSLDQSGWGTDHEIEVLATMLQVKIIVSSLWNLKRRVWMEYKPVFCNSTCMETSEYKIYIFHNDSKDHFDRVIPTLE